LLASAPCDVLGLLLRREGLLVAGKWMTLVGAAGVALATASGFLAQSALGAHSAAGEALLHLHRALGFVVAVPWVPLALWRILSKPAFPLKLRTFYLSFVFAGVALLVLETGLGTTLVYQYGLGLSAAARAEPVAPQR
jgi:uncharacterized membrane protein